MWNINFQVSCSAWLRQVSAMTHLGLINSCKKLICHPAMHLLVSENTVSTRTSTHARAVTHVRALARTHARTYSPRNRNYKYLVSSEWKVHFQNHRYEQPRARTHTGCEVRLLILWSAGIAEKKGDHSWQSNDSWTGRHKYYVSADDPCGSELPPPVCCLHDSAQTAPVPFFFVFFLIISCLAQWHSRNKQE